MPTTDATPRPWTLNRTYVDADPHGDGCRVASCHSSTFAPSLLIAAANARLIVRAVNAHEALLAACKAMIEEYEAGVNIQPFEIREMCRAAIRLAEEGHTDAK